MRCVNLSTFQPDFHPILKYRLSIQQITTTQPCNPSTNQPPATIHPYPPKGVRRQVILHDRFAQNKAMKYLFTITLALIISLSAFTQNNGRVTGRVGLDNGKPGEQATITLLRGKDSVLVKTALPDKTGTFEIENIRPGQYIVSISHTGYTRYLSNAIVIDAAQSVVTLPAITLQAAQTAMSEVKVEARRPFIERKSDKLVVNVEGSIAATGGTVLDVLERSPGVIVNAESGLSLKGKQGVLVMLDGKPTPLSGADLINYLRSVPSSSIQSIEIITQPSARYDASGNAGIINIKFKKDQRQGFNGNLTFSAGQGQYFKPSAGTNLNYRKKKWNIFGNYAIANPTGFTRFYINRKFFTPQREVASIFDQTSFNKQQFMNHNAKWGVDFSPSRKTIIGLMFNVNVNKNDRDGSTHSVVTRADGSTQYTSATNLNLDGRNKNAFANLNFRHTFDSTGRELSMDADIGRYKSTAFQQFANIYFDAAGTQTNSNRLKTDQIGTITLKSVKLDYIHPLPQQAKIEAGIKTSFVRTNSDIKFFNILNGTDVLDQNQSNHFIYNENVNAAYASFAKEWKGTDIQLGLRMEHTNTKGNQVTTGQRFSRNYVLFFPSFAINQQLNKHNALSFSYSRRIDRPSYRQLNPFKIFVDPYTYVVGDPALKPVLTNSFEISHTLNNKYIASLSYTQSRDVITDIFAQDDVTKISYQIPANLQNFDQWNLGLTIPVSVKKWLNSNITGSAYWNKYTSPLQGGNLVNDYASWDINVNNNFTIGKKGWSAELTGFYQARNAWGLFIINNLAQVSTGIQKLSKNKQSTFKLSVSDIFYTNRIAVDVRYQNMDFFTDRTWDSRVVTLSFTHRFGKNTVARARQRTTGVEDEKRRAG